MRSVREPAEGPLDAPSGLAQAGLVMERRVTSGEAQRGRYFWVSDGLIIRDACKGCSAVH